MAEGNKRREWVKNAVIIFLAVMLILTFFSNTIMNWSLPEVSAQYVSSGQLSEQIRGTATVEAAESYNVKINETRTVASIEVRVGDTVEKGQTLIKLEAGDSAELEKARDELDAAEIEYKKMLLSSGNDYSLDELAIANLEEDIAEDKAELKNISAYQDDYEKAKKAVKAAQDEVNALTKKQKDHENQLLLANSEKETDLSSLDEGYYKQIKNAMNDLEKYDKEKAAATAEADKLKEQLIAEVDDAEIKKKEVEINSINSVLAELQIKIDNAYVSGNFDDAEKYKAELSSEEIKRKNLEIEYENLLRKSSDGSTIKFRYENAKRRQNDAEEDYDKYKKRLESVKASVIKDITAKKDKNDDLLEKANDKLKEAQEAEAEAKTKASMTLEEAEDKIKDKERELEIKKLTLAQAQKKDLESSGSSAIDVEVKQKAIEKLKERVQKLENDAAGGEITAQVAGVIDSLSCVAGETVEGGSNVAVIQMTEKGYTASINVTADQAKKVKPGDEAEVQYFWYGDAKAVLTAINADKTNPQRKQLVFGVTGDIAPGQSLQLVMGGKGQQYEFLVPNSAIREDNNGKFILSVTAKSSPLGNRYIANRIDIQVLASDDTTSAVSGEIMRGEFIISTSTKPINPGDQVRLVNN